MRKYYIDNIRWITIVLVVFYHVIYMFNGIATSGVIGPFRNPQYQDGILYLLYPWFMILLFLLAGMCSRYYLATHTLKEFVRSRTRKLLVPSTVGLLTVGWIQGYVSMSISNAFATILDSVPGIALYFIMVLSGTGVLWFVQTLWLFSMLLALCLHIDHAVLHRKKKAPSAPRVRFLMLLFLVIPVYLSGQILNAPVIVVYRFGIYGFTFFLGYSVFAHDEVIDCLSRHRIFLLIAALSLAVIYLLLHYGDNYAVTPTVNCISATAYGWIACLAILGWMKKYGDVMPWFAAFLTKRSFGLYILHYLPLSATAYVLHKYTDLQALPCYLLTASAAFAGSYALYELIVRIPVLSWCVLGNRKEKKLS